MKKLTIHLVSEFSGQTVSHVAKAAISKFSDIEVKKYHWPMVKNQEILEEVFKKVRQKPGLVLYTISNENLRNLLKKISYEVKVPCISAVGKIVKEISEYLGIHADKAVGYINKFDDQYFKKLAAIEYALRHDDGKNLDNLEEADIVLIGASRTSKTPTSIYLAYNGFKTANIAFIHNNSFADILYQISHPMIVGLLINPNRLIAIRENRMNLLQVREYSDYIDPVMVKDECRQIKQLCLAQKWNTIDVSIRSIEETAAMIIKLYYEYKYKKNKKRNCS